MASSNVSASMAIDPIVTRRLAGAADMTSSLRNGARIGQVYIQDGDGVGRQNLAQLGRPRSQRNRGIDGREAARAPGVRVSLAPVHLAARAQVDLGGHGVLS